jgi:bis(5'-nucleosyl)-tetraphosphatase (symmetrical)
MSTYVIGDLQGCFDTLEALLDRIRFRRDRDTLWFVGDLVNRGAGSLACLRFVSSLPKRTVVTLGNHDLHLLAVSEGAAKTKSLDTLDDILDAPDREPLLDWLRHQSLLHVESEFAMVHAGLHPAWSWRTAQTLAREVERALRGPRYRELLEKMYGNEPDQWSSTLRGFARLRFAINVMTRMRALGENDTINLRYKGSVPEMPADLTPWFMRKNVRRSARVVVTGHWSALDLAKHEDAHQFVGIDTGCIWGRSLTAYRLDDRKVFQQPSVEKSHPEAWD